MSEYKVNWEARLDAIRASLARIEKETARQLAKLRVEFVNAPNRDCFTHEEVATMAGKSVATIRRHEKERKICARYPMAERCFHVMDVDRYFRVFAPKAALKRAHNQRAVKRKTKEEAGP